MNSNLIDRSDTLDTVSAAAVSDHDAVDFVYGEPVERIQPTHSMYRMSFSFIRQIAIHNSDVNLVITDLISHARADMEDRGVEPHTQPGID